MATEEDRFIQEATMKNKGSLRRYAKKHRTLNQDGTINLEETEQVARKEKGRTRLRRLRKINLARTLRKLRR